MTFETFNGLFDTLRSLLSSNESIDEEKMQIILSNKNNLLNILSNMPRNIAQRNSLSRADIDGIQFESLPERRKLPRLIIDECFALSDLFDLNEQSALLMLIEGESLLPNYPDCTRGLLAVQLYYEAKERLAACLAYLMAGVRGRTFQSLMKSNESTEFCTNFVEDLVGQRLLENIIDQLIQFQIRTEEQKLYSKAGLGNVKHRRRVHDFIKHIRSFQAKSVFLYSCQIRLTPSHMLSIVNYLAKHAAVQDDGIMDESALYLLGAFLYGITLTLTVPSEAIGGSSSILTSKHQQFSLQEDQPLSPLENTAMSSAFAIDPAFVTAIRDTLTSDERWAVPELKAVCQLAWAIVLRARSHALAEGHLYSEDIEALADTAVEAHVFAFLSETIIKSPLFQQEEFLVRRFHSLFVDFIYYLPFKLKELRVQAEDTARTIEDCERARKPLPDNLQRDYEYFLELLSTFYANDPMGLHLSEEFWIAADALAGHRLMHSPTQQQVALANFVESAGGTLSAYLYCHYIHMLAGISSTQSSAHACFELLRFAKDTGGPTCWNRIFQAFLLYRNTYRPDTLLNQQQQSSSSFGSSSLSNVKTIAPKEVTALIAVLNLIEVIAAQDEVSRIGFFEHPQWQITGAFFGLLSCRISLDLKAALLNTLSAFTITPEIAMHFWKIIGEIDLFAPMDNSDMPTLAYEIEEFEVPSQKYTFLRACLKFLQPIIVRQLKTNIDIRTLGYCVVFLVNHVLIKMSTRVFKSLQEKWQIAEIVLAILYEIVTNYFSNRMIDNEVISNGTEQKPISPGELLVSDLLRGGVLYTLLTALITDGCEKLAECIPFSGEQELAKCLILAMRLFEYVTINSQQMLQMDKSSTFAFCQTPIERMVTDTNTKDLFPNIMRLIDMIDYFPQLSHQALSIFSKAFSEDTLQKPFLRLLPNDHKEKALLRNGLVRCLEFTEPDSDPINEETNDTNLKSRMRYTVLWLLSKSLGYVSMQSNIGHYLCGFTRQHQLESVDFYFTLTGKRSRMNNCLQAILTFLDDLSPTTIHVYPQTLPLCYEVLFLLCTKNSSTINKITFDLLHEYVFVQKQMQFYLPLVVVSNENDSKIFKYSIETYLLRLIAQELFHLTNEPTLISKNLIETTVRLLFESVDIKLNRLTSSLLHSSAPTPIHRQEFLIQQFQTPNMDMNKIENVLRACQYIERPNLKLYRIDALKKFLFNELKSILQEPIETTNDDNDDNEQNHQHQLDDCKLILAYATQLNNEQIEIYWRNTHVDAWRQLVELLLHLDIVHSDLFPFDLCTFLYEHMIESAAVLDDQQISHLMSIYLTALIRMKQSKFIREHQTDIFIIFKDLLALIQARFTAKGRSSIYGALVECLELIDHAEQHDDLRRILNNALTNNGNLLTIIYDDALAVVPAVRSSASTLLTSLLMIDTSDVILTHFNQPFLRSLENELRQLMCAVVQSLQTSGTIDLKTWHSFSSYMTLLLRISSFNNGAQLIVSSNIFDALLPLIDFHMDARRLQQDGEANRSGRWMFGRTLAFVIDLTVTSLMANLRTKEKIYQFASQLSELVLKILVSPFDSLCTLHEIDTVLKLVYALDVSTESTARSIDGQLQRMRRGVLQLLPMLVRDDLFRHLLSQADVARMRQIISTTYWRVCFYILAIITRLVHQNSPDLVEHLPAILKLCEWITLNTINMSQADKTALVAFCQLAPEQMSVPKMKQDLLLHMLRLMDSNASLYNLH